MNTNTKGQDSSGSHNAPDHSDSSHNAPDQNVCRFSLEPDEPLRFAELCGQFNQHLKQIEERLKVTIRNRGNVFAIRGDDGQAEVAGEVLKRLFRETGKAEPLSPNTVHLFLQESAIEWIHEAPDHKLASLRT
nr:PhoH family protein [Endozoicomonas sp.]